jgi:glycine cleavage system aminomethyltransferase T
MRRSPLHDLLTKRGATFQERSGELVPMKFSSFEKEYNAVRQKVGITDFSFTQRMRVPEEGLDVFEKYAAGSVANIRFGRVLHTLAADDDGMAESDLYIGNDDEHLILIGESLVDNASTKKVLEGLGAAQAGLMDISDETALIGLDGVEAWAVARDLFTADVLGLPYLSLETYELNDIEIKLIRGGKTSEFGYLLLVPADRAVEVWERLEEAGAKYGIEPVGLETHMALRLDGRFFNIHSEGASIKDPLPLGLQWMIDFDGDDFRGKAAISDRRAAGLKKKIIGIVPQNSDGTLEVGDIIQHRKETVADVVAACYSPTLGSSIGLAQFDLEYAYAGLELIGDDDRVIRTVSLPPFTAKSLGIKLDEM